MASSESCIPPGFRFHPTDEELVGYYLKRKVSSQKIDFNVIKEIDLYRIEPWDLKERCRFGYEEQNEWYFFSYKDRKYPTGTRTNRATMAGFWKATGRDKSVYDKMKLIGMRKTLVFYKGRAPNGQKTDWIMHEYRLESEESNGSSQEEGWVVCRAFKKRPSNCLSRSGSERWDSIGYFYDNDQIGMSSIADTIDLTKNSRQPYQRSSSSCKKESPHELLENNLDLMHGWDHIVQLPQLESPSLTQLAKRRGLTSSMCLESNNINIEDDGEKVRDWRALDKFVASQLSHEESTTTNDGEGPSNSNYGVDHDHNADMGLLLLHSGREDGNNNNSNNNNNKLDGMLSSSGSAFDIGICI